MNVRIKKKKWKQAAARSRAKRSQAIEEWGADDEQVVRDCFAHFLLFGEDLIGFTKDPMLVPLEVRKALDDAILNGTKK